MYPNILTKKIYQFKLIYLLFFLIIIRRNRKKQQVMSNYFK